MDTAALRAEILSGPLAAELAPHVATRHDAMIALIMSEPRYPVAGSVSRAQFAVWAASGPRAAIEDHATNAASALRASALSLRDFLLGAGSTDLDLADPAVAQLLDAWVAASAITAEQRDALLAIGARTISRAEQIGLGASIHHSAVSAALNSGA